MKKTILFMIVVVGIIRLSVAQEVTLHTYMQQTVMGLQQGAGIRLQTNHGWGVGFAYQESAISRHENSNEKYPFTGMEAIIPLKKCGDLQFHFTPKVGFVNHDFFVLIPEVETEIQLTEKFSTAITAGIRARQSAIGVKIMFHI